MSIYIGEVLDIKDYADGERIKARILPCDKYKTVDEIDYSFPLLPKMIHVKPKAGEAVLVVVADEGNQNSQRYYIGPIISQPQFIRKDDFLFGGTRLLKGSLKSPEEAPSLKPNIDGSFCTDEDIAVYGRGNTDLILGENDLRLRCGSRMFSTTGTDNLSFNKKTPAFLKLSQHENALVDDSKSSAVLTADNINILSNNGSPYFDLYDKDEQVSFDELNKIIDKAHVLPYGDVLVDFLTMFLQMFKSHTHKYANMPPCPDDESKKLDMKYGTGTGVYDKNSYNYSRGSNEYNRYEDTNVTFKGLGEKLLSKHVRIN